MSVDGDTSSAGEPAEPDSQESALSTMAVTNYGSQIKFNYGTISNYFCHHDHQSTFPSSTVSLSSQLHTKLQTGCALYKSERYIEAKVLFYEVLHAQDSDLSADALLAVQYDLARVHFALSEYSDAARNFDNIMKAHEKERGQEGDETDSSLRDSRFWLARSLFHLEKYDDASMHLQLFVVAQVKLDTQQVTKARLWLGLTFERQELYDYARQELEMAHSLLVTEFGSEHLETLASRHHLANFFYKQKSFLKALGHFRELLEVEERMSGPEKAEAIKTRCMVALCLGQLGRLREAEPHLQQLVPRMELDPNFKSNELEDAGLMYFWLGSIMMRERHPRSDSKASTLLHRALDSLSTNQHLKEEFAQCQMCLAEIAQRQGHFSQAEHTIRQTLPILGTAKEGDSLRGHYALAESLFHQRKVTEAQQTLEDALSDQNASEGRLDCLHLLGITHRKLNNLDRAQQCFQQVVDNTPMDPKALSIDSRSMLGIVFCELEDFESARKHLQHAQQLINILSIRRHHVERTDPEIDATLGWALCALKLFEEAEPQLRPILAIRSQLKRSSGDRLLGRTYLCLGQISFHRNSFREAYGYLESALPMIARYFGVNERLYLECRYNIACCHIKMGNYIKAKPIFEELLENKCEHVFARDVRSILAPFWLSHICFKMSRRIEDAEEYGRRALEALGDNHSCQGVQRKEVIFHRARSLYWTQREEAVEECRALMQQVVENEPSDIDEERQMFVGKYGAWLAWCRDLIARCNHHTRRFEEAYNMFQISIPAIERYYGYDGVECALSRSYWADCLGELGRFEEAEPFLIDVAAKRLKNEDGKDNWREAQIKAIGLFWLGRQAFSKGRFGTAAEKFHHARRLWPSTRKRFWDFRSFDCRYFLACIDIEQKRHKDGQASLTELLRQQQEAGYISGAADSRYMLAVSLDSQNRKSSLQTAKDVYQQIIDDNQEGNFKKNLIPRSFHLRGLCIFYEGNYQEAEIHFQQAIDSPLNWFTSIYYKGRCLYHMGMYSDAVSWFSTAVEIETCTPRPSQILDCLYWAGRSHIGLGSWLEAKEKLHRAYLPSHKNWRFASACRYFLGQALFAIGEYTEAKGHFEELQKTPGKLEEMPLGSDYYFGCCLLELGQFDVAKDALVPSAELKKRKSTNELAIMSAKFQLLRCWKGQGNVFDATMEDMMDTVFTYFESSCITTKSDENPDPAIALIEYHLALMAMFYQRLERAIVFFKLALAKHEIKSKQSHSYSTLPVLQCQTELGVALQRVGRHEEALYPLCQVLEGLREPTAITEAPGSSTSLKQYNHQVRVMDAKLDLCRAAHYARHTSEAERLARDVLAWAQQQQEQQQDQHGQKQQEKQQQEPSFTESTDEQQQQPSDQKQSPQSHTIRKQPPPLNAAEVSYQHRSTTQLRAINAIVLLAQITHDLAADHAQTASLCVDGLAAISALKVDLPMHNFDSDEIHLHAYLALSLSKLPGRRHEAEKLARKAMELEQTARDVMAKEKASYHRGIAGVVEEFATVTVVDGLGEK
ncbi:TPR-like protein [Nemania serpens]|nr:TPR-like protein [Nemania serpens]